MDAPTITNPNIPLIRETRAFIAAHPDLHDQEHFHCGTVACFAGHAAILAGARWFTNPASTWDMEADLTVMVTAPGEPDPVMVSGYAATVLGLNPHEVDALFFDAEDLQAVDARLAELEALAAYTEAGHPAPSLTHEQWCDGAPALEAYIEWREAAIAWNNTVELAGADA